MKHSELFSIRGIKKLPKFDLSNLDKFPQAQGVYFFVANNKGRRIILYVGYTKNLSRRMQYHEVIRYIKHFYSFDFLIYYWATNTLYISIYEKDYIRKFRPHFNMACISNKKRKSIRKLYREQVNSEK